MPGYRSHLGVGFITGIAWYAVLHIPSMAYPITYNMPALALVLTLSGSLFPDIDIKSKGQKIFYGILLLLLISCMIYCYHTVYITLSLLSITPLLVRHRGIFHNGIWIIIMTLTASISIARFFCLPYGDAFYYGSFFLCGAFSHIVLDRCISRLKR